MLSREEQEQISHSTEPGRIQDFGLGGRSSAEGVRIEAPQEPNKVGYGEGVSPSPLGKGSGDEESPRSFFLILGSLSEYFLCILWPA